MPPRRERDTSRYGSGYPAVANSVEAMTSSAPAPRRPVLAHAELGTPADIRFLFHAGRIEEGAAAFRAHVEQHALEALEQLGTELEHGPRTALLCLEADPATCHRRVLTDALQGRHPDLRVVDL